MAKSNFIELPGCEAIPILYEDRSVLAVDKPRGWMLVPVSWQKTSRNLQAAINSSIAARDFWARSRGLNYLRYVHRLDADTSGVLLFAKSSGAVRSFSALFESRRMDKTYLAVVAAEPKESGWICRLRLAPDPKRHGRMKVDARSGKVAETHFRVLDKIPRLTLIECKPVTGRTHQIRVHLAESGCSVVGDELYGKSLTRNVGGAVLPHRPAEQQPGAAKSLGTVVEDRVGDLPLGLRAVRLAYANPFTRRRVDIRAPVENFLKEYGFDPLSK